MCFKSKKEEERIGRIEVREIIDIDSLLIKLFHSNV